tara:strand:- start:1281 stop:1517 length:237 start_codon:yes stop_codon:yes gene_type:complete
MEVKNMNIDITTLNKLPKYKENLLVSDDYIFSYLTKVAVIDHENREILVDTWFSSTTSKHINYVGKEYNYKVVTLYQK